MRMTALLLAAALLFAGAAQAAGAETPPALILEADGFTEKPGFGNYSWSYPVSGQEEWTGVEACGMAPTDPAVPDTFGHLYLTEDQTCTIGWEGTPPDELIVFSWDIAVFTDQEHIDDYQENSETVIRRADGKIMLRPDRVYDFQAKWHPAGGEDRPYGNASYYLVTDQLIMLDGPGSVMTGGWTPSADYTVTGDLKKLFEKGTETLTGARYIPAVYLGSQAVAGTNHAFLCQAAAAYPGSLKTEPAWAVVCLYEDLQGSVFVLSIADLDIGSFCTCGDE